MTFEAMLTGYADAAARFDEAGLRRDPVLTYTALFEALNWAVAIDDRVRDHWMPDAQKLGWGWRARLGHGAEVMGGVRFARNAVHHDWSDVLSLRGGTTLPRELPFPFHVWTWKPADALPSPKQPPFPNDERMYRERMERQPARNCLDVIGGAFIALRSVLEPGRSGGTYAAQDVPRLLSGRSDAA